MITLIKWRIQKKLRLTEGDLKLVRRFALLNHIELVLVLIIPFVATIMARGGFH